MPSSRTALVSIMTMRLYCGGVAAAAFSILSLSGVAWAQTPQEFISATPCRIVDTRVGTGTFGGPTLAAGQTRVFPIPASACGIPANASAYVLNVTAIPQGPLIFLTMWPDGLTQPNVSTLNSPAGNVIANAAIIPAGTNGAVDVYVSNKSDVILDINGYFVPVSSSTSDSTSTAFGTGASNAGTDNTAMGFNTLAVNSGSGNTAMGAYGLSANTLGNNNVGIGASTLLLNAIGSANTAVGGQALLNDLGDDNTAVGFSALWTNNIGLSNTAVGVSALYSNGAGSFNIAVGQNALYNMGSGASNIAVGYKAGDLLTSGNNDIFIGSEGQASDGGVIRIGTAPNQASTYIAGISGTNVTGATVLVNANGQLGVATSSQRFKEDVRDMDQASDGLMLLRPVTFRYKQPFEDGAKPLQYGLIGEEVGKIYPELVVYDRNGQVESLAYHELPALLLNELQKQHKTIEQLEQRIAALEAMLKGARR